MESTNKPAARPLANIDPNRAVLFPTPFVAAQEAKGIKLGKENAASEAGKKPVAASRKRKSDAADEPQELPEIDDDDPRLDVITDTCNGIRSKIRRFIESGAMKVGEFQGAIDVSSVAYSRFMNQTGTNDGFGSTVYAQASRFFRKRELQGLKAVPPKKRARSQKSSGQTKASKAKEMEALFDVSSISLEGEDEGDVPVYDTCDDIRKKIRAFLRRDGVTQAAFLRAISKAFPESRTLQTSQLQTFLGQKGATRGNTSKVFYGAYVFFEKLRIKEKKPKTEKRLTMEEIYGPDNRQRDDGLPGMDRSRPLEGGSLLLHVSQSACYDEYGQLHITSWM